MIRRIRFVLLMVVARFLEYAEVCSVARCQAVKRTFYLSRRRAPGLPGTARHRL